MSTHNILVSISKRKSRYIIPNLHLWDFFQWTQERVRNIHGKRAISVRAIEVLLYTVFFPPGECYSTCADIPHGKVAPWCNEIVINKCKYSCDENYKINEKVGTFVTCVWGEWTPYRGPWLKEKLCIRRFSIIVAFYIN